MWKSTLEPSKGGKTPCSHRDLLRLGHVPCASRHFPRTLRPMNSFSPLAPHCDFNIGGSFLDLEIYVRRNGFTSSDAPGVLTQPNYSRSNADIQSLVSLRHELHATVIIFEAEIRPPKVKNTFIPCNITEIHLKISQRTEPNNEASLRLIDK